MEWQYIYNLGDQWRRDIIHEKENSRISIWGGVSGGGGETIITFWTFLVTCEALNRHYKIFGERDLASMKYYNWGIIALNLESIVCEG